MNVALYTLQTMLITQLLCSQDLPYQPVFLLCALAACMIDTNHKKFQIALSVIGYLLIVLEHTVVAKGILPPLLLPGTTYEPHLLNLILRQGISFLSFFASYSMMAAMTVEYVCHLMGVELSLEMAQEVTDKLISYDTTGALAVLEDQKGKAQAAMHLRLINALFQMASNLAKYRPFLPNHLLEGDQTTPPQSPHFQRADSTPPESPAHTSPRIPPQALPESPKSPKIDNPMVPPVVEVSGGILLRFDCYSLIRPTVILTMRCLAPEDTKLQTFVVAAVQNVRALHGVVHQYRAGSQCH